MVPLFRLGGLVSTEGMAYAFFLFFCERFTAALFAPTLRTIVGMAVTTLLLMQTRPQFVFLVPVIGCYLCWVLLTTRERSVR